MTEVAYLLNAPVLASLSSPRQEVTTVTMEELGQSFGFVLYRTNVTGPLSNSELIIEKVRDRALVFINQQFLGIVDRNDELTHLHVTADTTSIELDLLVENMGRINYGPYLRDPKGITEGVYDSLFY